MTRHRDTGGGTLLEPPKTDEAQAIPKKAAPTKPRMRFYFPLAAIIVGALAVLGVWAAAQTRMVDEFVDTPRVYSDHDSWIDGRLSQQASATQAHAGQLDPWIRGYLRERDHAGETSSGTGPGLEHDAQSLPNPDTATDRAARHHEPDDQRYLNQLGNDEAGAPPLECRPTSRPVPC